LTTIALFFLFNIGGGLLVLLYEYYSPGSNSEIYFTGLGQILFLLIPLFFIAKRIPLPRKELFSLRAPKIKHLLYSLLGLVGIQLFAISSYSIQEAMVPESMMPMYNELLEFIEKMYSSLLGGNDTFSLIRGLIIGALIPAVCEEFLMRGYLQNSLLQRLNYKWAILVSAGLFAVIHINPVGLIPLFLIGLYLGAVVYLTKSIFAGTFVHLLHNALAISVIFSPGLSEMDKQSQYLPLEQAVIFAFLGLGLCFVSLYLIKKY
jgi:membrane protease YdiL (CAAX protease family)